MVLSKSDVTGEISYKRVVNTFVKQTQAIYKVTFNDGTVIETTWNHPFRVQKQGYTSETFSIENSSWVDAKELLTGHVTLGADGQKLVIRDIKVDERAETVYNFEVEEYHTYFVGEVGIWVHNDAKCAGASFFTTLAEDAAYSYLMVKGLLGSYSQETWDGVERGTNEIRKNCGCEDDDDWDKASTASTVSSTLIAGWGVARLIKKGVTKLGGKADDIATQVGKSADEANEATRGLTRVKENAHMSPEARKYESKALGYMPGQSPALKYKNPNPNGKNIVKFDGVDESTKTMIDRKLAIRGQEKSVDQATRQSKALRQNGYSGRWEVPNEAERRKAEKLLLDNNIENIKVKVVPFGD